MARPCISAPLTPFSHPGSRMTLLPWRGRRTIWSRSTASSSSFRGYLCSPPLQRSGVSCPAVAAAVISSFVCRLNIRSVINMQLPGEHAHCGPSLDPESGFTYSPQVFMDNESEICLFTDVLQRYSENQSALTYAWYGDTGIISNICVFAVYFYNFGMPDYGVSSLVGIIDGVKVLAFAVREGRVAVHCHAGLGRTGAVASLVVVHECSCVISPCVCMCVCHFPIRRSDRLLPGLHSPPQPQRGRPLCEDQTASLHPDPGADQPGVWLRSAALHAAGPVPGPEPAARRPVHPAALPESTSVAAARPGGTRTQIHAKGQILTLPPTQLAGLQNAPPLTCRWCTSFACGSPAWPWGFLLLQRSTQSWRRGQHWRLWTGWWGRPWWQNITCPC